MDNRIAVCLPSGSGGGGRTVVGWADGTVGMRVRFHNQGGGASDVDNPITPSDPLVISAIANDVVTATGLTSGKTYKDYAFYTVTPSNDEVLTGTGAQNWPTGTSPKHYPFI